MSREFSAVKFLVGREEPMTDVIRSGDAVIFKATGIEVTGRQLSKKAAGERLRELAAQELRRSRSQAKSYSDVFVETCRINPEIVRAYLGLE